MKIGVEHTPPATGQPDTIFRHAYDIWTIYLRVVIKNQFTTESDKTIRVRFGYTSWGGARSSSSYGWGE